MKSLRCIPNRKPIRLQPYPSTPRLLSDFNGFRANDEITLCRSEKQKQWLT